MKRELTTSRRLLPALPRPTTLRRRPDSSLSEPFARSDHIGLFLWAIGIVRRMETIGRKWLGAVPKSSARRKNLKNSETRKIIAVRHFQVSVCPASTPIHPPLGAAAGVQVLDFTLPQFLELVSLDTPFFFHHGLRMPEPC